MRPTLAAILLCLAAPAIAAPPTGYYREPAVRGSTVVFVAEGDLWRVPVEGGVATRLTSHPGDESTPAISPDESTVAFAASYEGPSEVYTMPLEGGIPVRRTFGASRVEVTGWTPEGEVLFSTNAHSTLPTRQLAVLEATAMAAGNYVRIPLSQAADGTMDEDGTLYFTRFPFNGSHTRRYKGGAAQDVWKFSGNDEAQNLTKDFDGTDKRPMAWNGRVYFASDRDGVMNLWSMAPDGSDPKQHTRHDIFEVRSPSLGDGRIVYQLGADIRLFDIASGEDRPVPITLASDLDQLREHWIQKPVEYVTSAHVSPDGDRVVLTARGRVFVLPHRQGRLVEATRNEGVRYRDARFMPDGKSLLVLSDASGEVEMWTLPADGVGEAKQLTKDGEILRWEALPSPDGKRIAHRDKLQRLFLYDVNSKSNKLVDTSPVDAFQDLAWSPDGRWLAYVVTAENAFRVVRLLDTNSGKTTEATSDRFDSYSPVWSPDGKWLYLLSDRNLASSVSSPWGNYQPEPHLGKKSQIFQIPLVEGLRSPFAPKDELFKEQESDTTEVRVTITLEGIRERLIRVPVDPGDYDDLVATKDALFWTSRTPGEDDPDLMAVEVARENLEVKTVMKKVQLAELSKDGKKLLLRKDNAFYIVDAKAEEAKTEKKDVDISGWKLSVQPREEWRQMFVEAWRLERDYFYDRGMHGVDWKKMLETYRPLADRVASRAELSDLLSQMVSELSALHTYVYGGEMRKGPDDVALGNLGAELVRDDSKGGYRVTHVYLSDPDEPDRRGPLRRQGVDVKEGDVITHINGAPVLEGPHAGGLLRNQASRQVRLRVDPASGDDRDVIVTPMSASEASDLRYHEWEHTRRLRVEEAGKGEIGYVHLRGMGTGNFTEWAKGFYPIYTRKGLILDARNNTGGNIDSWILGRLLRKAWHHWSQPVGHSPTWNMQYAFLGHVVVLVNERTASDGEILAEGIRRLGIGEIIGTRTWGGEIWLTSSNTLVDSGIATAAEYGVYGPEGEWLIENVGVLPDIVVDNPPHATFQGEDAQLEAAIRRLQERIREEPVEIPKPPAFPDKSK